MRVLVCGGAGYIGSVLIPIYSAKVIVLFFFGKEALKDVESDRNLTIVKDDIRFLTLNY